MAARKAPSIGQTGYDEALRAIVHDMRTPLATIAAATDLLEACQADELAQWTVMIKRQTERLERMLDELAEGGSAAGYRQRSAISDLAAPVRECIEEARLTHASHEFVLDLGAEQLRAALDPEDVRRIVTNLLTNACNYSPPATHVYVRLRRHPADAAMALIEVEDEGPGVPDSWKLDVFQPFVRLADTVPGHGLGLHIVRCLAASNRGYAWVEDGARGALFKVALPVVREPKPSFAGRSPSSAKGRLNLQLSPAG